MAESNIKNVILDLGGVIINLDQKRTIAEINRLAAIADFDKIYSQAAQGELFNQFDKGQISEEDFFETLSNDLRYKGDRQRLVDAWNAMLLDVPPHRLDTLVQLKMQYNTYLLSNTCETHVREFERALYHHHGVRNFDDYFDRVYYSCRVGLRKPEHHIFEMVLEENGLNPGETVFIDDSVQHVRGAGECGIRSHLLPEKTELRDFLVSLHLL